MSDPLRIAFSLLHRGPVSREWRIEKPEETLGVLPVEIGPVDLRIEARGTPRDGVRVRGTLKTTARGECRRCLADVAVDLAPALDVWFRLEDQVTPGEDGVWPFSHDAGEIDLRDAVREELLLALPDYPVCGETCRGICASCGANLSEEECECPPPEPDPRWAALRDVDVT